MLDLAIVILHYNTIQNTVECVDSIRAKLIGKSYYIIIVDNASPNNTFSELKRLYQNDGDVFLIKNNENLGFARGNNVGYLYAKRYLNPRFIMMINNDTKILQTDFIEKISTIYEREHFYVLGPMILSADGKYTSNPVRLNLITKDGVDRTIHHYKKELIYLKLHILWMQNLYHRFKSIFKKKPIMDIDPTRIYKNVELHGCCLIFSKKYIDEYDGLDDRTFMYEEERILYKHMMDAGHLMIYDPSIIIFHKERATTTEVIKRTKGQDEFLWRNSLDSALVLRGLYKDEVKH